VPHEISLINKLLRNLIQLCIAVLFENVTTGN